jgi:hypothetical protein
LSTTDAGIGKVASLAGAAAVEKARLGVPSNEVVVPVVTTTGHSIQVAEFYMLKSNLPALCFVLPELRFSVESERIKAAQIFIAMAHHAEKVKEFIDCSIQSKALTPRPKLKMEFDSEAYHITSIRCGSSFRVVEK